MAQEGKILIVDDNKGILDSLAFSLKNDFKQIEISPDPNRIPKLLDENDFDIILLDMNFKQGVNDGREGLEWLGKILKIDPNAVVIIITAYGDVEIAVKAIKEGATDFIVKPWDTEKLIATLKSAYKLRRTEIEVINLRQQQKQLKEDIDKQHEMFVGSSEAMQSVMKTIGKVAKTDANILIMGENGTGKELIAREIHKQSKRSDEVFISVDIGSLSESIFESELFGHVKGSFTDAKESRPGRFETASGGTLFIDEIGNLTLQLQSKILSAIQNREVFRIGSNKPIPIDIRLVCATNKSLYQMVKDSLFREDLLYRINTIQVELPPLRERGEDIIQLTEFFLNKYKKKYEKPFLKITQRAHDKLLHYNWPGNVRELQHTIEKAVILSESDTLKPEDFFFNIHGSKDEPNRDSLNLEDVERETIRVALKKNLGNLSQTAKDLGVTRTTLYSKIKKYGL